MLEKHSSKAIAAIALAALAVLSFPLVTPAYSEELDIFGVEKIYPTAQGGNEWYVDMDDPYSDPMLRNREALTRQPDGSWQVSGGDNGQVRLEAWSPENEKWLNVEITEYAKMESGSNELLQLYSRGGHHTSRDECLGSAYKARLYGDGVAAWNKELTHPAYAGNRAETRATTEPLEDRWIGFKAVIYNFVEDGDTYVRLESYIDDDVTDEDGNLVVRNNWKLASVYEDRGGWRTNDGDFDSSCGRDRDEILTRPGGTDSQNIAAFRSDDLTWSFKYLSVREIDPTRSEQPATEEPAEPAPVEETEEPAPEVPKDNETSTELAEILANKAGEAHVDGDANVESIQLSARKMLLSADGKLVVAIVQGGSMIASTELGVEDVPSLTYTQLTATFEEPVQVEGGFDIIIAHIGVGRILIGSITLGAPA